MDIDLTADPLGMGTDGTPVYLKDLWPSSEEIAAAATSAISPGSFRDRYASVFRGDERWRSLDVPEGDTFSWDQSSTYVLRAPFFDDIADEPAPVSDIRAARVLAWLGDSVTTDHISPAGSISPTSPAGRYLISKGVERADFNSYGARRGNHEVMMRGTFANVRLRNRLAPDTEGGITRHLPDGEEMSIFDAAERYRAERVPLIVLAGKEYGSGSSRDWAAKGPALLGVRAVVAESFERIHRSNLVGMGIAPLELPAGTTIESSGLDPEGTFEVIGIEALGRGEMPKEVTVRSGTVELAVRLRIDTPMEAEYFRHGGILTYVLRQLAAS
jgi:aconitate hydratase